MNHGGLVSGRRGLGSKAGRLASVAALLAALALAACTAAPPTMVLPQAAAPAPAKQAATDMPAAVLREHQRILAAYGGVYDDPRLQTLIEQTVDRLVAASEKPDLHYKVTILNSQSINAFALPNGQLYVTRGLIALAARASLSRRWSLPLSRSRPARRRRPRSLRRRQRRRRPNRRSPSFHPPSCANTSASSPPMAASTTIRGFKR